MPAMALRLFTSVRGRLLGLLTGLFAIYLAAILGLYAYLLGHERQQASERALDFARSFAAEYERQFGEARELLEVLATLPPADGTNPAACGELLAGLTRIHPQLMNLAVLDGAGGIRCAATMPERAQDLAAIPAVRRAIDGGRLAATTLQHGPVHGKPAVVLARPAAISAGKVRRVVLASLDLEAMNRRFAASVPPGAVLRILDHDGVFLVRQPEPECCLGRSGLNLFGIREALAGGRPHLGESPWMDEVIRVHADVPLGGDTKSGAGAEGVVSVGIPVDLVQAPANRALAGGILSLLLLSALLYALAWTGSNRYLLRPIGLLAAASRRLRAGDLASRVSLPEYGGEFAELEAAFNDMAGTLAANRLELEADRRRLQLAASVFDHAREAIFVTDAEGGILAVNKRFSEITGYGAEEAIGRNPSLLRSGRHDDAFYRAMWQALADGGHWSGDVWNRRKDGTIYPEWLSITAVRDEQGRTTNYSAVFTDLSRRRELENRLRENEARLTTLIEAIPDPVFLKDGENRWCLINQAAQRLFGLDDARWQGRHDAELALLQPGRSGEHMACHASDEQAWRNGRLSRFTEVFQSENEDNRIFDVIKVPLFGEGGRRSGLVVIGRDVTDQKKHEHALLHLNEELERRVAERTGALLSANRELEAFSYSVSHDLRAPLRAINGFSRLIEEECAGQLDETGRHYLDRVRSGAERMGALIDDLLALSRLSRQEMKTGPVNLSALAAGIARELEAGEPGRRVEWQIAADVTAKGDAGLLAAALQNLLGNAWKYSSKRERSRIEFGAGEENGQPVYFVRDNGAGFDMAYADKLFGAFQRLHAPDEFPGTGIGLATVARIVQRHGGTIRAESAPDRGATFRFTLAP